MPEDSQAFFVRLNGTRRGYCLNKVSGTFLWQSEHTFHNSLLQNTAHRADDANRRVFVASIPNFTNPATLTKTQKLPFPLISNPINTFNGLSSPTSMSRNALAFGFFNDQHNTQPAT